MSLRDLLFIYVALIDDQFDNNYLELANYSFSKQKIMYVMTCDYQYII